MGSLRSAALISMILFITFILLGVIVASVITGITSETTSGSTTEEDYEQLIEETIDEIATYIQVRDQLGKYYNVDGVQKIQKMAFLISPLVSQDIDVTGLTIMLNNGDDVRILYYNGNSAELDSNSLFEHSIWSSLESNEFSFISLIDQDDSLVDFNVINDYRDNAYLVFKLPPNMQLVKRDNMVITLFPSTGIDRNIYIEAPPALTSVVDFV